MFGSHTLWNDLLAAGLVDEVHLMVGAVVLGDGTPAFAARRRLPSAARPAPGEGSSNILLRYAATPDPV